MEFIFAFVLGGVVVGGFFYWRGHKEEVRNRVGNAIDKAKGK